MTAPYRLRSCSECPHQILNGIACDWQPHECPIQIEKQRRQKQSRTEAFFISNSLIAGDFDAVRSSN
jgi:hypothetical protein